MSEKKGDAAMKTDALEAKPICGIVMPISTIEGCSEAHWAEVLQILSDAIEDAGFMPNLVSNADDVGVIQKRIIQNLYENPIVVCDVSAKNSNVMFELGMRLAFDKPTIIVKDDETAFSFDTAPIEHLPYPRDLRFSKIVAFKAELTAKISATYKKASTDSDYTTFLKHFGTFKVAKLETREVGSNELLAEEMRQMRIAIASLTRGPARVGPTGIVIDGGTCWVSFKRSPPSEALRSAKDVLLSSGMGISESRGPNGELMMKIRGVQNGQESRLKELLSEFFGSAVDETVFAGGNPLL